MAKQKGSLALQKELLKLIKKNPEISMSKLEKLTGSNYNSIKKHCKTLEEFGFIKIKKTKKTTILEPV